MNGDAVCTPARRDASVLDLNRFALLFYWGSCVFAMGGSLVVLLRRGEETRISNIELRNFECRSVESPSAMFFL